MPIIGWPLSGEQFYNANMLKEEWGVCVEMARGERAGHYHKQGCGFRHGGDSDGSDGEGRRDAAAVEGDQGGDGGVLEGGERVVEEGDGGFLAGDESPVK